MYLLVGELAADRKIPVAVTCRVTRLFHTGVFPYFVWRRNPVSQRDCDNAHLINATVAIHSDEPGSGYRFNADEIEAESGIPASERRVWRLCSQPRIWSFFSKKRGLHRKAGPPVHDDVVRRDFTVQRANQLWLTDITEHWTAWIQGISALQNQLSRPCPTTRVRSSTWSAPSAFVVLSPACQVADKHRLSR